MPNFVNQIPKIQKSVSSSAKAAATVSVRPSASIIFRHSLRLYQTSTASMVAQKIDGTSIAKYVQMLEESQVLKVLCLGRFENKSRMRL